MPRKPAPPLAAEPAQDRAKALDDEMRRLVEGALASGDSLPCGPGPAGPGTAAREGLELTLHHVQPDGSTLYVTFQRAADGTERLVPTKLVYLNDAGIRSADVRALPLAELDRSANAPGSLESHRKWTEAAAAPVRRPGEYESQGEFFAHLSLRYAQVLRETRAPAPVLAGESGVPVTTVHRWIREARRLGWLPKARPGAAG